MTTISEIQTVVAERLAAQGVGVYKPSGVYTTTETGIIIKTMPASPDRVIVVGAYSEDASADPRDPVKLVMVQLRFRAGQHPNDVDELADSALLAMTVHHDTWSGVRINRSHRRSLTPLGVDSNRRYERSDNYEIILG